MKFAILTNVPNSIGRQAVKREAERRGHVLELITWYEQEVSTASISNVVDQLARYDVVHHATGLGAYMAAAVEAELTQRGVFCVNNTGGRSHGVGSKMFQTIAFVRDGILIPRTWRSHRPSYEVLARALGEPFVAKDARGTKGSQVWLIKHPEDLQVLTAGKEYLFQEYIKSDGDFRIHFVGGRIVCPYKRTPPPGDFRANVSCGGMMSRIESEDERKTLSDLAVQAAHSMRLDYCGVDIIRSLEDGKYYVLETNSDPGFKGVEELTGESFSEPIIDYYERATKKSI